MGALINLTNMLLSNESQDLVRKTLNFHCERKEEEFSSERQELKFDFWETAEQEVRWLALDSLKKDFEIACNDYGFDQCEEWDDEIDSINSEFKLALIDFIKKWRYE